jgi:hypothetical protein
MLFGKTMSAYCMNYMKRIFTLSVAGVNEDGTYNYHCASNG